VVLVLLSAGWFGIGDTPFADEAIERDLATVFSKDYMIAHHLGCGVRE
jgi:hypothetical protein